MRRIRTAFCWFLVLGIALSGACMAPAVNQVAFSEAVAHQKRGDRERARQAYARMVQENIRTVGLENNRAVLDLGDGNWDAALRRLGEELRETPDLVAAQANRLFALFLVEERREEALAAARQVKNQQKSSPGVQLAAGIVLLSSPKDWQQASQLLTRLTETGEPKIRAHAHYALGLALGKRGQWKDAVMQFRAHTLLERNVSAHYNRALLLAKLNRLADALSETHVALSLDSNNVDARHLQALVLMRLGNWSMADAAAKAALAVDPKRAGLYLVAGHVKLQMADWGGAIRDFQQESKNSPTSTAAWFNLGVAHCHERAWQQAITAFQKVMELDPMDRQAAENLRIVRELEGVREL